MRDLSKIGKKALRRVMDRMGPGCDVISQKISEGMDRPLPLADRLRIRLHLLFCVFCTRYRRQLLILRRVAKVQREREEAYQGTEQGGLSEKARERIKKALHPPAGR